MKATVPLLCIWLAAVSTEKLNELIDNLGAHLHVSTNIFYSLTFGNSFEYVMSTTQLPRLLITNETDLEWRYYFDANVLSVVWLEDDRPLLERQLQLFKKTLNRWHHVNVLFVTSALIDAAAVDAQWKWLFEWCWHNGFANVLLADRMTEILLTLDPFPHVQISLLSDVQQYVAHRNRVPDLKGYPVRIGIGNNPPITFIYKDRTGKEVFSGYLPRIAMLFAQHYNATLEMTSFTALPDYSVYKCAKSFETRELDLCADGAYMNMKRIISQPRKLVHMYLITPYDQPVEKFQYFVLPFESTVWLLIALSVCYIAVMLSVISWRLHGKWHLGHFFVQAISCLLYISHNLSALRGRRHLFVFVILTISGFMLSNLYLAILSSILTTDIDGQQINTLEDLKKFNIKIIITSQDRQMFKIFSVPKVILEQAVEVNVDLRREYRKNLDNRYAYINNIDSINLFFYQQKYLRRPRVKYLEKPLLSLWGGMPLREYWPFERLFNNFYSRVEDSGLFDYHRMQTILAAVQEKYIHFFRTEMYEVVPLSVEYFTMPAFLLAGGFAAATMCFAMELVRHRIATKRNGH